MRRRDLSPYLIGFASGLFVSSWANLRNALSALPYEPTAAAPIPPTIYGLLHLAKTAGTEINGELALRHSRVCGNKGYSYDAYQSNLRHVRAHERRNCTNLKGCVRDSVQRLYGKAWNRGRVHSRLMDEIGFEECDYVAVERQFSFWTEHFAPLGGIGVRKELHVPCRADPVDHLMSMANHMGKTFDCSVKPIFGDVERMTMTLNRFDESLLDEGNNITVRCFQSIPIEPYLQYMSTRLERRKVEAPYFHRDEKATVRARNREEECMWTHPRVEARVRKILLAKYPYFSFCDRCLGSEQDLLYKG